MLISIIVPVYNVEKYLRECLDSIINQTYKNIEIILVDDGSTDGSGAICDEYALIDNRISVLHISNGGVSNARNLGIDNAHGEYIMFVDADDIIMPYVIEHGVKLAVDSSADIVYGLVQTFNSNIFLEKQVKSNKLVLAEEDIKKLATHMFDLHDATFKNENAYVSRGPVARFVSSELAISTKFDSKLVLGEDEIWNLELLNKNPRCAIDFSLWYGYRFIENSSSHRYRENAKREYSDKMISYLKFTDKFNAEQYCFNKGWSSLMEVCNNYYLKSDYIHTIFYATKDLHKYLLEYPWNKIFCFSWACKNGAKGIIKWILLKCNLVLVFKLLKSKIR